MQSIRTAIALIVQEKVVYALGKIKNKKAIKPLIEKIDNSHSQLQALIKIALTKFNHQPTIAILPEQLSDPDRNLRILAVEALSHTCKDEIDPTLLSRDCDADKPFLDPQEAIDRDRITFASEELEIPIEEVKIRYRSLAQKFNLTLTFDDPTDSEY